MQKLLRRCRRGGFILLAGLLFVLSSNASANTIVVYGDSISAAYGLAPQEGWVSLLEARLQDDFPQYEVINASVSGETTGGGVTRLPKTLEVHQPDVFVLELGGNDGLRGYPIDKIRTNIESMITGALDTGSRVLLIGMVLPPNYGKRYTTAFEGVFADLAAKYELPFVPFLLDGVATQSELVQRDGIHPTAEAQPRMLEDIWPSLVPLL